MLLTRFTLENPLFDRGWHLYCGCRAAAGQPGAPPDPQAELPILGGGARDRVLKAGVVLDHLAAVGGPRLSSIIPRLRVELDRQWFEGIEAAMGARAPTQAGHFTLLLVPGCAPAKSGRPLCSRTKTKPEGACMLTRSHPDDTQNTADHTQIRRAGLCSRGWPPLRRPQR
jgi:hypothetical protein